MRRLAFSEASWLGKGTFGAVFTARDMMTKEMFALKLSKGDSLDDLMHEHRILMRISHQNIIACYGISKVDAKARMGLIMELVPCRSTKCEIAQHGAVQHSK